MHHYNVNDFLMYFQDSWIVHPDTGVVVQVMGQDDDGRIKFSKGPPLHLNELDWKDVCVPTLGWRTLDDGKGVLYISKAPRRQASKGVTPSAIVIEQPSLLASVIKATSGDKYLANGRLSEKISKEIHTPTFTPLQEAVKKITSNDHSVGFALANHWAISLSLHDAWPMLLWYKTSPVGHSKTGKSWTFNDKDSSNLFNRSFANV